MGSLDTIHRCTVGGNAFQLEDFSLAAQPVVTNGRRSGTRLAIRGQGWIEAANPTALAAGIADAIGSCLLSGRDFQIFGPGNVLLYEVPAALCLNGGPHVSFSVERGLLDAAGARHFNFELSAETVDTGAGGEPTSPTYALQVDTGPDGLRVVTWTGTVAAAPGAATGQFTELLEEFREAYPRPRWVVSYTFKRDVADARGEFTARAQELAADLPAESAANYAVDGSYTSREERDEQMRLLLIEEWTLAAVGDVDKLLTLIRPKDVPVLRESVDVTTFPHQTVRATFVTLTGGNGNALMNWSATIQYSHPAVGVYDQRTYAGLDPVLVLRERTVGRLVYSGSAVGAGVYIDPPPPPDTLALLEQPQRSWSKPNEIERGTDWTYVLAIGPGDKLTPVDLLKLLARPTTVPPIPPGLARARPE